MTLRHKCEHYLMVNTTLIVDGSGFGAKFSNFFWFSHRTIHIAYKQRYRSMQVSYLRPTPIRLRHLHLY